MVVSPAIARAPAVLKVRVTINAMPDDRMLYVAAESASYYRSSEIQLDGTESIPLNVFEFRGLPPGMYQITGIVVNAHGPRATVSRIAQAASGVAADKSPRTRAFVPSRSAAGNVWPPSRRPHILRALRISRQNVNRSANCICRGVPR